MRSFTSDLIDIPSLDYTGEIAKIEPNTHHYTWREEGRNQFLPITMLYCHQQLLAPLKKGIQDMQKQLRSHMHRKTCKCTYILTNYKAIDEVGKGAFGGVEILIVVTQGAVML